MTNWFSRLIRPPQYIPQAPAQPAQHTIDLKPIVDSFDLLRNATLEVSAAATSAAEVLQTRLWDSEYRLQSLLDSVDDLIVIKDSQSRWITVNRAAQEILGLRRKDYLNKTVQEIVRSCPYTRSCLEELRETDVTDAGVWESRSSQRYRRVIQHKGAQRHYDIVKTPTYDDDGSPKEIILVGRDVTELLDIDRRMKACFVALNSASDPIVILNSEGKIIFSNDRFSASYDSDYYNTTGKTLHEALPGFPHYNEVWDIVHHNNVWEGEFQGYHISVMPVMNGVPYPIYYICTFKKKRC